MEIAKLIAYLVEQDVLTTTKVDIVPLSGGVSCEILLIDDGKKRFVLKRALEKLKVEDDWFADVKRNEIEQRYLKYVATFFFDSVPAIIYSDSKHHFFCMEMLENGLKNWKEQLLNKNYDVAFAKKAGELLGAIHFKSAGDRGVAKDFDTLANFHELRIDPYLLKTGERHPELASYFQKEAVRLSEQKICLVHGDFSPKNILVSPNRLVVLDCEVAWYGDPVFDVAFLLNHFVLKSLYLSEDIEMLMQLAKEVWISYKKEAKILVNEGFEKQLIHLLLMLMLARVDGKSPVEYLNASQKKIIRDFVYQELPSANNSFECFKNKWLKYNTIVL
ncbi:phosphotransferase family protein [Flavivirga algicola]|uniref:Aminoglycoside phosphotransferase family protein n=1 Tax=Flavivirga algicola TaxID=2729136 RepID=A0ABX1S0X8_9FLAO|nr:aminoglycoside phosphotransferase family protein [Flavivirga algicola]NMH89535.1 aminoglycoside phosphotransferase family protein [Flavivirga algicola]